MISITSQLAKPCGDDSALNFIYITRESYWHFTDQNPLLSHWLVSSGRRWRSHRLYLVEIRKPSETTWASNQTSKIAGCACAGNAGDVSSGQRKPLVSDPVMHPGTRHSRRMRNPQFYLSGKRPMDSYSQVILSEFLFNTPRSWTTFRQWR